MQKDQGQGQREMGSREKRKKGYQMQREYQGREGQLKTDRSVKRVNYSLLWFRESQLEFPGTYAA
jgi:hypothetical protein